MNQLAGKTTTWGFRINGLGAFGAGSAITPGQAMTEENDVSTSEFTWAAVPTTNTLVTTTDKAALTGDVYDVWYGASAGTTAPGIYKTNTQAIVWTAVANASL